MIVFICGSILTIPILRGTGEWKPTSRGKENQGFGYAEISYNNLEKHYRCNLNYTGGRYDQIPFIRPTKLTLKVQV